MANTTLKILTVGAARGSIKELFSKIKAIDTKHGKFELVLCVGDFFGPSEEQYRSKEVDELLNGDIEVPIPCYVMQGDNPIPEAVIQKFSKSGSEICPNLYLLSKSGMRTTSHGLRIACLGGVYDEQIYATAETPLGFSDPYFSSQTIEKLRENISTSTTSTKGNSTSLLDRMQAASSSHLVDIFISQAWPASIAHQSKSGPSSIPYGRAVGAVDDIVRLAKPKYHFSPGIGYPPQFWEREPFTWSDENERVSRFISLGDFGGEQGPGKKPRWFYAFSISPNNPTTQTKPANVTANPFTSGFASSIKRSANMDEVDNFIFGAIHQPATKKPRHERREGGKPPPGYKCRRCDSEEHYIQDCPDRETPPEGYICRHCKTPGHYIRDCPEKNAVGDTGGKKPPPGYVCRACASDLHYIQDCPTAKQTRREPHEQRGRRGAPPREIGPGECWFCLSNPSLAKHLIVGIGSECYITLTKGPIIPTGTYADPSTDISKVPGGGHALIVPIAHFPTFLAVPRELSGSLIEEINSYKKAFASLYIAYDCVAVSFEVGLINTRGGHGHAQVVPVPKRLSKDIESTFQSEAERLGMSFEDVPEKALQACAGGKGSYFRVDLPDGRMMVHLVKQDVPFSIQFGRQVICKLLGVPDRLDWKACAQTEDEEMADAKSFKEAFAPFDPAQN